MKNQDFFLILVLSFCFNFSLFAQKGDTATARQYLEMGVKLQDSTQFNAALALIEKASDIYASTLGNQNPKYAKTLYHQANILRVLDKGKLANKLGFQALAIQETQLDSQDIDVGYSYIMLSKLLVFQAKHDSAEVFLHKAKDIAKVNEDKWFQGEVLKAEAYFYSTQDSKQNIILLDSTLQVVQTHFPNNKIRIGELYYRLGSTYNDFNIATSNGYLEKSLDIFNTIPQLYYWKGVSNFMLGVNYINTSKLDKGFQHTTTALQHFRKVFPDDHFMNIQCNMNLALIESYRDKPKKAIRVYKDMVTALDKISNPNYGLYATIYQNIGALYFDLGDYFNAETYNKKAITYSKKDKAASEDLASIYINQAINYAYLDLEEQTELYLQKAANLIADCTTLDCQKTKRNLFFNIGSMNFDKGDTEKSLAYSFKALSIFKQLKDSINLIDVYINIALGYSVLNQNELAQKYLEDALLILENHIPNNNLVRATIYKAISQIYHSKENYNQAENYLLSTIALQEKEAPEDKTTLARLYSNIATTYQTSKQYRLAKQYANKALNLERALYGKESPKLALTHLDLAIIDCKQQQWEAATNRLNTVAKLLQVSEQNWLLDIRQENYIKYFSTQIYLFNALFKKTKEERYLDSILLNVHNALLYEQAITSQLKTDFAKRQFFQYTHEYYTAGIEAYYQQIVANNSKPVDALNRLYQLSEQNSQKIVRFNLNSVKAATFANFPIAQQKKEKTLANEVTWLEKKVAVLPAQEGVSQDSISQLQEEVATAKLNYFDFLDTIKQQYPQYYQLKHSNKTSSITMIQQSLSANQTMLKYILADSSIYILGITTNNFSVKSIKKDSLFEHHLQNLLSYSKSLVADSETEKRVKKILSESGHYLYQQLMLPVQAMLKEKLIIIPSQQLYQLSFDLLLQDKPSLEVGYKDWAFLIKNHAISYAFSATLYEQQKDRTPSEATLSLYAIAPFFGDSTSIDSSAIASRGFGPLEYNQTEAIAIANLFSNKELALTEEASLSDFLKRAGMSKIIHLSTHALADDQRGDYCQIIFSDVDTSASTRLYAKDLYGLTLDADMVVLSACETALGELQPGEGVIGLNRGFTYAGARSVVTSLWQVDDQATKDLMVTFYKNLQNGLNKDEALRQAKLTLLEGNNLQPYLWAAFVPFGNMEAIVIDKPWNWTYLSITGLFMGIVGIYVFLSGRFLKSKNA